MCQSINDERVKSYYQKKLSEGKTPRQARKCLAGQLINSIVKIFKNCLNIRLTKLLKARKELLGDSFRCF